MAGYDHPSTSAVVICKNCPKGACRTCVMGVGNGLASRVRSQRAGETNIFNIFITRQNLPREGVQ
jgi:ferredoxin